MAMLAEPRRKKRYHLTPKGKPLFEDSDRFGTKMLEKMGWSKGKGLGKGEDGTQDFVRVKYKSDEKGLGFEARDDQWTEHDIKFNGLLQNLNGGPVACPDDCEMITPTVGLGFATKSSNKKKLKDKISGQSLEENSKKSKARVHYQKFTKGKDMSQYSEKDLANIFGKKATPEDTNIYSQFQAFNAASSDSDGNKDAQQNGVQEEPEEDGLPIINTGVSVQDYFKAKMAALKKRNGVVSSNPFGGNVRIINNVEVVIPSAKRKRSTDSEVSEAKEEIVPQKKEKAKSLEVEVLEEDKVAKKKKKAKSLKVDESESIKQAADSEEIVAKHEARNTKKSKKQSTEDEESDSTIKNEEPGEEESSKKKKKSKKLAGLKDKAIDTNDEQDQTNPESGSEESNSSKKKKTSKKSTEENLKTTCIPSEGDIPKKKKKKDKQKTAEAINPSSIEEETSIESRTEDIEETPMLIEKIKSKKKKNKTLTPSPSIVAEVSSHQKDLNYNITNENNFLLDTYTISTFCAEKFRNLEHHQFQGSNLMDLNGYGLSANLNLDIQKISNDSERIIRLWSGTLDKYTHSTSTHKMYSSYIEKVKHARKTKKRIPSLKFKSLKRQQVFQCV